MFHQYRHEISDRPAIEGFVLFQDNLLDTRARDMGKSLRETIDHLGDGFLFFFRVHGASFLPTVRLVNLVVVNSSATPASRAVRCDAVRCGAVRQMEERCGRSDGATGREMR